MQGQHSTSRLVCSPSFRHRRVLTRFAGKESYGGHYGPVFAAYIESMNVQPGTDAVKFSLESLIIVNGWMDPLIQV